METITFNTCRICLEQDGLLSVMTCEENNDLTIANMIMELTNIIIDIKDSLPNSICLNCAERVRNAYKLKIDCENADSKLRESFCNNQINEEKTFMIELDIKPTVSYQNRNELSCEEQDSSTIEIKKEVNDILENELQILLKNNKSLNLAKNDTEKIQPIVLKKTHTVINLNQESIENSENLKNKSDDNVESKIEREREVESLQCDQCNKVFQYRASLSNHMRVHKATPHKCTVCLKEFKLRQNLTNHMRTHTGEKPYQCDICMKKFSTRSNVFNHRRTHSSEKPYVCDVCGKQFPTISHLRNHNLSHVPISERKYKCEKCNKTFRDRKIFKRHLNIHNGIRNEMCEVCGKKFCNKNDVTRHHKTVHLGIKKYICSVCSKAFSNSSNLESHFRIHTGEKPFACKYCEAKFNQSTPLVKHTKIHVERGDTMKPVLDVNAPF